MIVTEPINIPIQDQTMPQAGKSKSYKKPAAIIAAIVLVVGGAVTTVAVQNNIAYAAETERLCTVAFNADKAALEELKVVVPAADDALDIALSTTLPNGVDASTQFVKRPAAKAVEAVKPVNASEGVAEVKEAKAVPARLSGAEMVKAVDDGAIAGIETLTKSGKPATTCTTREQATAITKVATANAEAAATLEADIAVMMEDFAVFQKAEIARVAAEKKAAAEAAAAEAARIEAEQIAAAQAAADAAALQAAQNYNAGGGGCPPQFSTCAG